LKLNNHRADPVISILRGDLCVCGEPDRRASTLTRSQEAIAYDMSILVALGRHWQAVSGVSAD
jgi:hypothetical protein